jgi:hypothetical protein
VRSTLAQPGPCATWSSVSKRGRTVHRASTRRQAAPRLTPGGPLERARARRGVRPPPRPRRPLTPPRAGRPGTAGPGRAPRRSAGPGPRVGTGSAAGDDLSAHPAASPTTGPAVAGEVCLGARPDPLPLLPRSSKRAITCRRDSASALSWSQSKLSDPGSESLSRSWSCGRPLPGRGRPGGQGATNRDQHGRLLADVARPSSRRATHARLGTGRPFHARCSLLAARCSLLAARCSLLATRRGLGSPPCRARSCSVVEDRLGSDGRAGS